MSALSPPPVRPAPIDPSALRLVLFGMPDAGKSSLLGALAQAAESQERSLHGHLVDLSNGLGELRDRVYQDRQRETQEEIVPYPVRFSPFGEPSRAAVLVDCDGRAANDLLRQKRSIVDENRAGTLAGAVLSADALILTVDAAAPESQVEDDFREFLRFLRFLEQHRGREHAIGGLPVYLVLTKCDLLARDGTVGHETWEARIDERKRDVAERFKQFVEADGLRNGQLAFGTIDLDVRATAVRQPALTDAPPKPREPFGVAELFQSAFEEANRFRQRQARAHQRMLWTVTGAGSLLAAMVIGGAVLLLNPQQTAEFTLADRIEALRASEGPTAATRLGPNLDRRMKEWLAIQSDPGFPQLSEQQQTFVRNRLEEGNAYIQFRDDVAAIPPPAQARSLADLSQTEVRLKKTAPPASYAGEWKETDAERQREQALTEVARIRDAVSRLRQFYFSLANRATALLQPDEVTIEWAQRINDLSAAETALPFPKTDPVLGPAYEYEDVILAERDWQRARDRLLLVRNFAQAIGMLGEVDRSPLAFPPLPANANIPEIGSARWQELQKDYPKHAQWSLDIVPDALRPEFEKRLHRSSDQAIREGQRLVREGLESVTGGKNGMPADWARVGDYLLAPARRDWRELVGVVARLLDPKAENPVNVTADFLRQRSFELDPKQIKVRIPDTLSDAPVKPAGDLALVLRKRGTDETVRRSLRQVGEPERDKQSLVYTFAASGDTSMTYRPGDTFYADLAVRKGSHDMKLTWANARTAAFQFEGLMREPRLHEPEQSSAEGLLAVGVKVTVTEGKFPAVPAMVPAVGPEKK